MDEFIIQPSRQVHGASLTVGTMTSRDQGGSEPCGSAGKLPLHTYEVKCLTLGTVNFDLAPVHG